MNVSTKKLNKSKSRPDWDRFWFLLAVLYSTRGTCDRLRTSCVIVKNKRLVGAGYNGSPAGAPHCDDVGHLMIKGHCDYEPKELLDQAVSRLEGPGGVFHK